MEGRVKGMKQALKWLEGWDKPRKQEMVEEEVMNWVLERMAGSGESFGDQSLSLELMKGEVLDHANTTNLRLIKQEIERFAEKLLKQFTHKSQKKEVKQPCAFICFANISHFTTAVTAYYTAVFDLYYPPDSLFRSHLPLKPLLLDYQNKLIHCYSRWKVEDLATVKQHVQNCIKENRVYEESVRGVGVMELEVLLEVVYMEHWEKVKETYANLCEYELPLALQKLFKQELKEKYRAEGRMRQAESEKSIVYLVQNQIFNLMHMSPDVMLFDEKYLSIEVRELVFVAAKRHSSQELQLFLGHLAEILSIQPDFDMDEESFRERLATFCRVSQVETKCFILLCLLLLLTGGVRYLPNGPQFQSGSIVISPYFALHQDFYRKVSLTLTNSHSSARFLSIDSWLLGKSTEMAVAIFLSEQKDNLVSILPDKSFEEIDRYDGQIAYNSTPETPAVRTFEWVKLLERPSLNTTIAVSGWQSEYGDSQIDWKQLIDYPNQGNLMNLRWDAGSHFRETVGAAIEPLAAMIGLVSTTAAQWTRDHWSSFQDACDRAERIGKLLAVNIERNAFGLGPVSLIGFSLGARAIFACLNQLKQMKVYGRVLDVILMGGAVSSSAESWTDVISGTVQGRTINLYSTQDWTLRAYKLVKTDVPIGLTLISSPAVENYDVTSIVNGHQAHRTKLHKMLSFIEYRP